MMKSLGVLFTAAGDINSLEEACLFILFKGVSLLLKIVKANKVNSS